MLLIDFAMLLAVLQVRCWNARKPEQFICSPKRTCQNLNPERLLTCSETEVLLQGAAAQS